MHDEHVIGPIVDENCRKIREILDQLTYRDWTFSIVGHAGWYKVLNIKLNAINSEYPEKTDLPPVLMIDHQFQVPWFPMQTEEIERWILDNVLLVERHETCERFKVNGKAIFFPEHGQGSDPYKIARR